MSLTHRIGCDNQCGENLRYTDPETKYLDGWVEVWVSEDESLDFCSKTCLVDYFDGREED